MTFMIELITINSVERVKSTNMPLDSMTATKYEPKTRLSKLIAQKQLIWAYTY